MTASRARDRLRDHWRRHLVVRLRCCQKREQNRGAVRSQVTAQQTMSIHTQALAEFLSFSLAAASFFSFSRHTSGFVFVSLQKLPFRGGQFSLPGGPPTTITLAFLQDQLSSDRSSISFLSKFLSQLVWETSSNIWYTHFIAYCTKHTKHTHSRAITPAGPNKRLSSTTPSWSHRYTWIPSVAWYVESCLFPSRLHTYIWCPTPPLWWGWFLFFFEICGFLIVRFRNSSGICMVMTHNGKG